MTDKPPLLAHLFEAERGYVLYKAYPPLRGDDVAALLNLRSILPPTVEFRPLAPAKTYLLDIRNLLPEVLTAWGDNLAIDVKPEKAIALPETASRSHRRKLLPFLRQAISHVKQPNSEPIDADNVYQLLEELHPDALRILLHFVSPPISPQTADEDDEVDTFRQHFDVNAEAPTLVLGRPEDFGGYGPTSLDDETEMTDFRRLMEYAGYANRFCFDGRKLRDRKTRVVYSGVERRQKDIGFILLSRRNTGQIVAIATGFSSLGTHAAVDLLLDNRADFRRAIDTFSHKKGPLCLDIGFQCRRERLSPDRLFPLAHPAERFAIDIVNTGDFVGYTWGRGVYKHFNFLLDLPSRKGPNKDIYESDRESVTCMEWSEEVINEKGKEPANRFRRIRIDVKQPQLIVPNRFLLPSALMFREFEKIKKDLKVDGAAWDRMLREWNKDLGEIAERASSYRTFRPILLLGPTGAGKQWAAEWIASRWAGETLAGEQDKWPSAGEVRAFEVLNAAHESLQKRLRQWKRPEHDRMRDDVSSSMLTFNAVSYPETLLDSALFGCTAAAATDVGEWPGAFTMAGTGVLFLDELLELPKEQQGRLLVALQEGCVRPVGGGSYPYVCRVVAATNRASTEDELEELIKQNEIRRDLVARFERRYVLPPLHARALEVFPILMELIRTERLFQTDPRLSPTVRVSRRAFEVLASYSYPNNIRDLRRLVSSLPQELIESFRKARTDTRDERAVAKRVIDLKHLVQFGVAKEEAEKALPHDDEIFEFTLNFDLPRVASRRRPAQKVEFNKREREVIVVALAGMHSAVMSKTEYSQAGELLRDLLENKETKFLDHFSELYKELFSKHKAKKLRPSHLRQEIQNIKEALGKKQHASFPFAHFFIKKDKGNGKEDLIEGKKNALSSFDKVIRRECEAIEKTRANLTQQSKNTGNRGKGRTLHKGVMLSMLVGHVIDGKELDREDASGREDL